MHQIFLLARVYPYWAIPLALVLGQLGIFFRRRKSRFQYTFWMLIAILMISSLAWLVMRGDRNADEWVRWFFQV